MTDMRNGILLSLVLLMGGASMLAQPAQPRQVQARRVYTVAVQERDGVAQSDFSSDLAAEIDHFGNRSFMSAFFDTYRSATANIFAETSVKAVNVLSQYAVEQIRSPRERWERAVRQESRFTKDLKMLSEIHHFYNQVSTLGPMDPTGMVFDGFTCSQSVDVNGENQTVFLVDCKLRTDSLGLRSMVADSRFLLYVDEVYFNPYLCDLPNDSLSNVDLRIPFDFDRRKNLKLNVKATVTSSWMNQVLQIVRDQELGSFDIEIKIDPSRLQTDSTGAQFFHYKYAPGNPDNRLVSVRGDSFIVPRSYVASRANHEDVWGMGQYKMNLAISETCEINKAYYMKEGSTTEYDKAAWEPEWKLIKNRPKSKTLWSDLVDSVTQGWGNGQWIVKTTSPASTFLIQQGKTLITGGSKTAATGAGATTTAASGSGASSPSAAPAGGGGKGPKGGAQ